MERGIDAGRATKLGNGVIMMRSKIKGSGVAKNPYRYSEKVLATRPANLIGFWPTPMVNVLGATIPDVSGKGHHITPVNVTLGAPTIGDGRPSLYFNGSTAYMPTPASFVNDFDGEEGTFLMWGLNHADSHDDSTLRRMVNFWTDANNFMIWAHNGNNSNVQMDYRADGVAEVTGIQLPDWPGELQQFAITWSNSAEVVIYYHLGLEASRDTDLGTWSDPLASAVIGASSIVPAQPFYGWLTHPAAWDVALSAAEMLSLATP